MTTSRFGRIDRRRLVASSMVGGAAILTAGHLVQAGPGGSQPLVPLAQDGGGSVPMFRGNAARTGEMPGPAPDTSGGVAELWRFTTDTEIELSSPIVASGAVYVGDNDGYLYAVDAKDGSLDWRFATGDWILSSPAVADGVVYVGSYDKIFYAIDAEDGTERWRFATGDRIGSSPAIADDVVYFSSADKNLYALNAGDGTERWRFSIANEPATYPVVLSSPAVTDGVVYVGAHDGTLHAVNAKDGTELWRLSIGERIDSSPAVVDGVVYVGSRNGSLYAVNTDDGTEQWRFPTGEHCSPAIADGVVYAGSSDGSLYALDAKQGTVRWQSMMNDSISSAPVVADRILFIGSYDKFHALSAEDGTELWHVGVRIESDSSPAVVDGAVYFVSASMGGNLHAIGTRVPQPEVGGTARVTEKTSLRGGPAATAVEREELTAGTVVTITGEAVQDGDDVTWWPVTVNDSGAQGWIEASKLEPQTSGGSSEPLILPTEAP